MRLLNVFLALLFITLFTQCEQNKEELSRLQTENESLKGHLDDKKSELVETKTMLDDEISMVNQLRNENIELTNQLKGATAKPKYKPEVMTLIKSLHAGWEALASESSKEKLKANFLSEYTVNGVQFNMEATPWVAQGADNFEAYLDELVKGSNWTLSFGQNRILDHEEWGDLFTIAYVNNFRVFLEKEEVRNRRVVTVISGKIENGQYKVGNYSWVSLPRKDY